LKPTATIEDWAIIATPVGTMLVGRILRHQRQEEFVKPLQMTSRLVKLDLVGKTAETENTLYTLGTPA
jgi:hypothetical protein